MGKCRKVSGPTHVVHAAKPAQQDDHADHGPPTGQEEILIVKSDVTSSDDRRSEEQPATFCQRDRIPPSRFNTMTLLCLAIPLADASREAASGAGAIAQTNCPAEANDRFIKLAHGVSAEGQPEGLSAARGIQVEDISRDK